MHADGMLFRTAASRIGHAVGTVHLSWVEQGLHIVLHSVDPDDAGQSKYQCSHLAACRNPVACAWPCARPPSTAQDPALCRSVGAQGTRTRAGLCVERCLVHKVLHCAGRCLAHKAVHKAGQVSVCRCLLHQPAVHETLCSTLSFSSCRGPCAEPCAFCKPPYQY